MRICMILPLALAACSPADAPDPSPESNAAVAPGTQPSPLASAAAPVALPPAPAPVATPSAAPANTVAEDSPEQDADAAAQLVRRYYRLIGRGDYAAAWALWDDGGRAAGMSRAAFADSFARYGRIDAAIGRPGRIDAGAGQRHVEVPVALTGTLKSGEPFAMRGAVVLHRAGPIDGATAEQRRWHIAQVNLRPGPAATPSAAAAGPATARYRCGDGSLLLVRFDRSGAAADVELGGELLGKLDGQRGGDTLRYGRGETVLRGNAEEVTLTRPDAEDVVCKVQR